jgi:hypothetical protein
MILKCELCDAIHSRCLLRTQHNHIEHLQQHLDAQTRILTLHPEEDESTNAMRLRIRGLIKLSLQNYMHQNQTSHELHPTHTITYPCTEAEFVALFKGLPFLLNGSHYSVDLGGKPALDILNLILGPGWETHEEVGTHKTCFVATTVNEIEYFVRINCNVRELVSIERSLDYSPDYTVEALDQTHLSMNYRIHSFVFVRPVNEQ